MTSVLDERVSSPAVTTGSTAVTVPSTGGRSWGSWLRAATATAVALAVAGLAIRHRSSIGAGGMSLVSADLEWLAFAFALTTALWVAGTASQLGAVAIRPPLTQLFAVQVAASAVNHVVPGGVGGMAVNVRYLQRSGLSRPAALAAVGLNSVATLVTHMALIAAIWAFAPRAQPGGGLLGGLHTGFALPAAAGLLPGGVRTVSLAAGVLAVGVAAAAIGAGAARRAALTTRAKAWGTAAISRVGEELRSAAAVLRRPGRAALLWAGSAASPALHALILLGVYNSLSGGLSPLTVALVYLVASSVSALIPSPGGFGALDVTLAAGLVAAGVPTTTALATVLGYRLLTVWVPLVPGALVFAALVRRRVL